jgi:hypothetical protein
MMAGMSAPAVSEAAATLHREALVLDSHNDSIVLHIRLGNRSFSERPAANISTRPTALSTHHGTIRYLR